MMYAIMLVQTMMETMSDGGVHDIGHVGFWNSIVSNKKFVAKSRMAFNEIFW
jgi:hypothetical protein